MEHDKEQNLKQLIDLAGEFAAYIELAAEKMMAWRLEITDQANLLKELSTQLNTKLNSANELLSQAGTESFRQVAERALNQGESNLINIEKICSQFSKKMEQQQDQLKTLTQQCIEKIDKHSSQSAHQLALQLAKYDVQHFNRIANESCDHIEKVAHNAVNKSNKMLKLFQVRTGIFTALTTIITSFILVYYLGDEAPWEMHRQALNERQAGKLLLQSWSNLTESEKSKILNHLSSQNG